MSNNEELQPKSSAKESTAAAKRQLELHKRAVREQEIADQHYEKMSKRAEARGRTIKRPKPIEIPPKELPPPKPPVKLPSVEEVSEPMDTSKSDDAVEDVVKKDARGKEALKQITKASTDGIRRASKTIGSEVLSPLLSMAILSEAPLLAAGLDKSIQSLKFISGGLFKFIKGTFFKDKEEDNSPLEEINDGIKNLDDEDFKFGVLSCLEDINDNIDLGNQMFLGLIEGLSDGVQDFRDDMLKINKEVPNNDTFLNKESEFESKIKEPQKTEKNTDKKNTLINGNGFLGFLPSMGSIKKLGNLILKITGITFVLGVVKKILPFGKTAEGKATSKSLKGISKKFGKLFKSIMKPIRFLVGPLMTGIRFLFMGLVAVLGTISAPVLAVIAVVAAIVAGVVLLARKLGDGDIMKGFGVMWDKIKDFSYNLWNSVKEGFDNVLGFVTNLPKQVFGGMKESFSGASELIKTKSMEFIDYITAIPSKILGWIKSQVEKIPVIGNLFKEGDNKTKDFAKNVVGGANDAISNMKSGVKNLGSSAIETVRKISTKTIVAGDKVTSLVEKIKENGNGAKKIVKDKTIGISESFVDGFLLPFKSVNFLKKPKTEKIVKNEIDFLPKPKTDKIVIDIIDVNAKTKRQNDAFMNNMTKSRENEYYNKIAGKSDDKANLSVQTQNNSTYNTTNVTHNRSSATMPKPIDMGY